MNNKDKYCNGSQHFKWYSPSQLLNKETSPAALCVNDSQLYIKGQCMSNTESNRVKVHMDMYVMKAMYLHVVRYPLKLKHHDRIWLESPVRGCKKRMEDVSAM